ncbi:MAG: tetratricopeptide repeat protein [Magnetococcales bacterium]|nr:tetratricopeptide repeat protein [Magnetococcales bacterium]
MNRAERLRQKKLSKKKSKSNLIAESKVADLQKAMQTAVAFHQSGQFDQAIQWYKETIKLQPDNVAALCNLGGILQSQKRLDEAIPCLQKAIALNPDLMESHYNLGNSFKDQGNLDGAVVCYQKTLALKPDFADAHCNLGIVLKDQNNLDAAIINYQKAIAIKPNFAQAYYNLGNALSSQGSMDAAIECYQKTIAINPNHALAHSNLGVALADLGRFDEAVISLQIAISINPDFLDAYSNLGNIMHKRGKLDEAVAIYQKAIAIQPGFATAHCNIGVVLQEQGKLDEAVLSYNRAIEAQPDLVTAYNNLGVVLQEQGKLGESIACYQKAIAIQPDDAQIYRHLGSVHEEQENLFEAAANYQKAVAIRPDYDEAYDSLGNILTLQGKFTESVICFQKAISINSGIAKYYNNLGVVMKEQGSLPEAITSFQTAVSLQPDYPEAHSNLLFSMHYANNNFHSIFNAHLLWNDHHAEYLQTFICRHIKNQDLEKKLNIGFVSGDFREHSVSYFLKALFTSYNRDKLAFYCYSNSHKEDSVTAFQKKMVDGWRNITNADDQAVVEMIQGDGIDILVDLSGHSKNNRLPVFACKPAPLQVTWLGYPNTTGLTTMDYRFTDHIADPPGQSDRINVEKLIRLPDGFLCYQPQTVTPEVAPLPLKSNGYITFGSFNNLAKLTPHVVKIWSKILNSVPDSKLLIKNRSLICPEVREKYLALFAAESIDVSRLILLKVDTSTFDHLSKYCRVDISLDTFPYNGTTTTCESLWMGVPTIVLRGDSHVSRVGASIMTHIGLEDLITENLDEYVEKASSLANDVCRLETLRTEMRSRIQNSPLCDGEGFSENIEMAFRSTWREWCHNDKKEDKVNIAVNHKRVETLSNENSSAGKPVVRIIHHLARTGGTLICKCIGSMDNVVLLSEINPRGSHFFNPLDQAAKWHGLVPEFEHEAHIANRPESFIAAIEQIQQSCQKQGKTLLIRDWTWLDFIGYPFRKPLYNLNLADVLSERFTIKSAITVRHPLDQWLSISAFNPNKFPLMDKKILDHVLYGSRRFSEKCTERDFIKYEDFTKNPDLQLKSICSQLDIEFDIEYKKRWQHYSLITGDRSGTRGKGSIASMPRRQVDNELLAIINSNPDYHAILDMLQYKE